VQITPICGQIHTEQNEALMQRDMRVAGAINAIGFLLLFLCVSRDWRVAAVFLLPVVTAGLTIGFCALVYPKLSTMMIGLTVAMAGSAVDYGIFVYTAVSMAKDPTANLRRILRPLLISHLTTLGVFVAFLFSKIPAYRQLGYLTSTSLILSLLAAIFVLPKLLKPGGSITGLGRGMPLARWGRKMVPVTILGAILLAAGIFVARKIKFDSDFTRLDGVSAAVRQNEADFQKEWARSDADLAILVVTGKTRDEAELANDEVYRIVSPHFAEGQFTSLSSFWPSAATRLANETRWRQFWSPQRASKLRQDLADAGAPYGFSATAFDPFFQTLSAPPPEEPPRLILASVEDQFTARAGHDWEMLNYFEDTPANTAAVRALIQNRPDAEMVSRGVLSQGFKTSAISETHLLVGISVAFITIALLVLTRSVVKSLIIMLPVLSGLIAMLAVLEMMSMQMSVVTVIASVIVLALTSDYGVFAAYACEGRENILGQGMASVHLSFVTTLVGTGVMLFAHHPALFQVGVSLTSGLVAGYLTAFFMIPGIYRLWDLLRRREVV
jgi:predicted exporter